MPFKESTPEDNRFGLICSADRIYIDNYGRHKIVDAGNIPPLALYHRATPNEMAHLICVLTRKYNYLNLMLDRLTEPEMEATA